MKKAEIKVGGIYIAKVSNKLTRVRVDAIRDVEGRSSGESYWKKTTPSSTRYEITNLVTGRKTTFRSAAKFRKEAPIQLQSATVQTRNGTESIPSIPYVTQPEPFTPDEFSEINNEPDYPNEFDGSRTNSNPRKDSQ